MYCGAIGRRAFTLVELMIVIAIIGALAAIAVPNYLGMQRRAKISSLRETASSTKVEVFHWMRALVSQEENTVDFDNDGTLDPLLAGPASIAEIDTFWVDLYTGVKFSPFSSGTDLFALGKACAVGTPGQIILDCEGNRCQILACDDRGGQLYSKRLAVDNW